MPVNNRIYVIGGTSSAPEPATYDTLSIGTGETTWRVEPPMPGGSVIQSSGCAIDGKIYLVAPAQKCAMRYDTTTRAWEALPVPPAEMTFYAAVCGEHKGEFWVMGGNSDKRSTFIYSPKTNSWRSGLILAHRYLPLASTATSIHHSIFPRSIWKQAGKHNFVTPALAPLPSLKVKLPQFTDTLSCSPRGIIGRLYLAAQ